MILERNSEGFIDLSLLIKEGKAINAIDFIYKLYIDGKKYFYKESVLSDDFGLYNELIAEELAKDYQIPCAHYDLAILDGIKGVISEDIIENNKYYDVCTLFEDYSKYIGSDCNSLKNILSMLEIKYDDPKVIKRLMDQLFNIFIFDILIANGDRRKENLIIIENEDGINFSKLLDNEDMMSINSIYHQEYKLVITDYDKKVVEEFVNSFDKNYIKILEDKLWIISDENIDSVLERVEKRIGAKISDKEKMNIKEKFKDNRNMIEKQIYDKKIENTIIY